MYNLTNITNSTTPWGLTAAINQASGQLLGIMTIASLWLVLFIVVQHNGFRAAWIGSSFIAAFIAVIMWAMGLITWWWCLIPAILGFVGVVLWLAVE